MEDAANLVPSALDEAAPPPGAGLPGHRSQPGEAGGLGAGHGAQLGNVDDQARRSNNAGEARDRGADPGPAQAGFLTSQKLRDPGVGALQLALDPHRTLLVDPLGQGMTQVLAAVESTSPVRDQRVADQPRLSEVVLVLGSRHDRARIVDCGGHPRQHARVYRVGLGTVPPRSCEAPDLVRIDRVEGESGLQQRFLEGPGSPCGPDLRLTDKHEQAFGRG